MQPDTILIIAYVILTIVDIKLIGNRIKRSKKIHDAYLLLTKIDKLAEKLKIE